MNFKSLTVDGFKSFGEKTFIEFEEGLTGLVGPNGCGKSNVVEALKFVMGESSARQLRGTELDQLIFSGNSNKSEKKYAELKLVIETDDQEIMKKFNSSGEIEIIRRIERNKGSFFYINQKPYRSKDVQLIFADKSSGARSVGIVSQGKIAELITSKPEDRRILLEEAANIKGLHQRKHEAELKLQNAELNIKRLDDILSQLDDQRQNLSKQYKEALRYHSISDRIRKANARLYLAKWNWNKSEKYKTEEKIIKLKDTNIVISKNIAVIEKTIEEKTAILGKSREKLDQNSIQLNQLNQEYYENKRKIDQIHFEIDSIDYKLKQNNDNKQKNNEDDLKYKNLLKNLETEKDSIEENIKEKSNFLGKFILTIQSKQEMVKDLEVKFNSDLVKYANHKDNKIFYEKNNVKLSEKIKETKISLDNQKNNLLLSQLEKKDIENKKYLAEIHDQISKINALEEKLKIAELELQKYKKEKLENENSISKLLFEHKTLKDLFSKEEKILDNPVSNKIKITNKMEKAFAICFFQELDFSLEENEDGYWNKNIVSKSSLYPPKVGKPLTSFYFGPEVIKNSIRGVAVIEDDKIGYKNQKNLIPGQSLVTKDGKLWRWDGLILSKKINNYSDIINKKQKLGILEDKIKTCEKELDVLNNKIHKYSLIYENLNKEIKISKELHESKSISQNFLQKEIETIKINIQQNKLRKIDLEEILFGAETELSELNDRFSYLNDNIEIETEYEKKQTELNSAKEALSNDTKIEAEAKQFINISKDKMHLISNQIKEYQISLNIIKIRLETLINEEKKLKLDKQKLENNPNDINDNISEINKKIDKTNITTNEVKSEIQQLDDQLQKHRNDLRKEEDSLSNIKQNLIKDQSTLERTIAELNFLETTINEKVMCSPEELNQIAKISKNEEVIAIDVLEKNVSRLLNERENMGPVNLRAEEEVNELDFKIKDINVEKNDLEETITKLRSAISKLNKESRTRLLKSFSEVNDYFLKLFNNLFGGGRAELHMVGSDDPLDAGIEIFASPPGKKIQSLSLLSGGEQALTALALIFSVFLTNPSPICVLDEADAALDDTNVNRFCSLIEMIEDKTKTKFIIVTHHRITMSQMDRLYGLTMEQKGLSKIVSVDLQTRQTLGQKSIA